MLESIGAELPIIVFLSLLNVEKYTILLNELFFDIEDLERIDRDMLLPQEILVENYDIHDEKSAAVALKPIITSIWNACGYPGISEASYCGSLLKEQEENK